MALTLFFGAAAAHPRVGRSDIMVITATLKAVAAAGNALGSSDRSEAYRAMSSTAERTADAREPKPAEFSCRAVIKPVAHAAPAKQHPDLLGASRPKTNVLAGGEATSRRSSS